MSTDTRPSAARERILETASRLFYTHGIHAVGVDWIIAESGVAKSTFYRHFPAKDDLVVSYLDRIDGSWSGQLHAAAAASGDSPQEQLVGMFDALAATCGHAGYRGCGFINAAAEHEFGTPVHDRTVAHKDAVRAWVRGLAARAGALDPEGLARALTMLLDGGLASGALDARTDAPAVAKESARVLIAAACGGPARGAGSTPAR